ncbi:hypothetical protein [Niabella aurantiaca]|nr:hypothetical protein [Niabella aurantiaca]
MNAITRSYKKWLSALKESRALLQYQLNTDPYLGQQSISLLE